MLFSSIHCQGKYLYTCMLFSEANVSKILMFFFSVYLCSDGSSATVLTNYTEVIGTLGSASAVNVVTTEQIPEGCAILTVSDRCEVHMMLKVSRLKHGHTK